MLVYWGGSRAFRSRVLARTEVGHPCRAAEVWKCVWLASRTTEAVWPLICLDVFWLVVSSLAQVADLKHLAQGGPGLFRGSPARTACARVPATATQRRTLDTHLQRLSLPSWVCADPGQAVIRYRGLDSFLRTHLLSSVGTLTLPGGIRGGGGGRVLLLWRSPPPPGLPLPRLLWHRSQNILSPPSSVPSAWAPASCIFHGMLRNSVATKEISLEFARRALSGHSNRSASPWIDPSSARRLQLCR